MLIDRNGKITHVALVSDMNSDLSSVQTADGIWLDRTYELEYHFSNKLGKVSSKYQTFTAAGTELISGINFGVHCFKEAFSKSLLDDDLMFEIRHISKSALIVWMSFYSPFGSPNLKQLRSGHGDEVVDLVLSARRGCKQSKEMVRALISAYMFIKIRSESAEVKKLIITDFATVAEPVIQRQIKSGEWRNGAGFGRIWSTESEFREVLRNGILGCVFE